jgi:hypothetical protein
MDVSNSPKFEKGIYCSESLVGHSAGHFGFHTQKSPILNQVGMDLNYEQLW